MRELTLAELDLIAGGYNDDDDEDIVVTGSPYPPPFQPPTYDWPPTSYGPSGPPSYPYTGGAPAAPAPDTSFAGTHFHSNVTNPTAEQQHAINEMHDRLNNDYAKIQNMDPNATLTIKMSDGSLQTVTGQEAKALFDNMQIQIDPSGASYSNGTSRGQSTDSNGITHFNIDLISGANGYIKSTDSQAYQDKSADYLIFHELGHNTAAGQAENSYESSHGTKDANGAYPDNERFANTIANAIESNIGLSPLYTETYGYDQSNSGFASPTPPPDSYDPGTGYGNGSYPGVS